MTAIESKPVTEPQTPGQWAVRWLAVISVAVVCASVPVVHLLWHGVLGNDAPVIRTRGQTAAPAITIDNALSGRWMAKKERELQEASPIVWSLRGHWNEMRYRAGIPQSDRVTFGDDEWLFMRNSIEPNNRRFERAKDKRLAVFAEVRDVVRKAGAELVMVILPDKARIYPDKVYPDGVLPDTKAGNYKTILAELDSLGIVNVDLATPMELMRKSITSTEPHDQLFFARDTHWRPGGALIAGQTVAAVIEQRFGSVLQPRLEMRLNGPSSVRAIGDLISQLGLLSVVLPDPDRDTRSVPMSLLTESLAEVRQYFGVERIGAAGSSATFRKDPDAEILVVGSSFADENGLTALTFALGRPVRATIIHGAAGILPLKEVMTELRQGTRAKVVVWEIVERGLFNGFWLDPKL